MNTMSDTNDITSPDVISRADVDRLDDIIEAAKDKRRQRRLEEMREFEESED